MKRYLVLLFILFSTSLNAEILSLGRQKKNFGNLDLKGAETFWGNDHSLDIRMEKNSYKDKKNNLLYFNFETENSELLKNIYPEASVFESKYFSSNEAHSGKRSALFNQRNHGIWIQSNQFFQGSFSIETWVKPFFFKKVSYIAQQNSIYNGKPVSLEIGIENAYIFVRALNLFSDLDKKSHSIELRSIVKLKLKKWQHILFQYKEENGTLALYLDGKEQDIQFAKDKKSIWLYEHQKLQKKLFIIGRQYIGLLDEFRIACATCSKNLGSSSQLKNGVSHVSSEFYTSFYPKLNLDLLNNKVYQKKGVVISNLLSFPQKQKIQFANINYNAHLERGTRVNLYMRYADYPFDPKSSPLKWRLVRNTSFELPSFRYFQWKVYLYSDPKGQVSPILRSIDIDYTLLEKPSKPRSVHLVKKLTSSSKICLEWAYSNQQRRDRNIQFYIYYGYMPGVYSGRLSDFTEEYDMSLNRHRVIINNDTILKNIKKYPKKNLPLLNPNTNYYFAISAYDKSIESKLSNEVHVTTEAPLVE